MTTKQNETPRLIAERIVKTYLDDRINDHQLIGQIEAALKDRDDTLPPPCVIYV